MTGDGDEIQRKVTRAVAWVGLASAVVAVLDASSLAILMWKWVSAADLGLATIAVTLFYFLDLATEAGLSSVLIQREHLDDDTISSVFWLNVIVSMIVFGLLFAIGPLIGLLHGQPVVGWMLIAYGTKLIYQNVYFVPAALLRREMRFKELSIVRTFANAGDAGAKIAFAAMGEPVWCFVAGPLARVFITGIGIQLCRPWRPRAVFRTQDARGMLAFGFKTTGSQYLQHFYNNISYQIVGFYFGETALGFYRVAYELVLYPINWVSNVVTQVAFPTLARLRGKPAELSAQFLRFSRQNLAIAVPILTVLVICADDVLATLFPEVAGGATAVRLLCVVGLLRAIDCLYLPLLDGLGFAGRNLGIAAIAAVVLTGGDLAFAALLGDELGYTSVAVARMVAYPIVIALHAKLALGEIALTARRYLTHLGGIVACGVGALVPAVAIDAILPVTTPVLRLAIVGGSAAAVALVLLSAFHGLGVRAIVRELKR